MSHFRTAAISAVFAMTRLASGLTVTSRPCAAGRARSSATGWVTKIAVGRSGRISDPPHDAGDAVDRDLRAVRNALRGVEHAEHHRNAALARERSEMRGRAAELGHHAGDARQHVAERRAGDPGHQHVAGRDARELAFAIDHDGAAGAPADAGGMAVEAGMLQPDLVRHGGRLDVERPRLQQLEARHRRAPIRSRPGRRDRFGLAQHAAERDRLRRRRGTARSTSSRGTACGTAPAPWPQVSR